MLKINMEDVFTVLNSCKPYLIGLAVALVVVIAIVIASRWIKEKTVRNLVRKEAGIAFFLAVVVLVNLMCVGPLNTMFSLVMGDGTITEESSAEATRLCTEVAEEGIVMLENKEQVLPLTDTDAVNVFGWASTNPCYGGTGSGSISDAYDTVSLLDGLEQSGLSVNQELVDFYTNYRADRPEVGMMQQDWTLPEPEVSSYSDELIKNAKDYSDKAIVVFTRVGGEGADLPTDVSKVTYTDNSSEYKDFEEGEHYLQLSHTEHDLLEMVCQNFEDVIVVINSANAMELDFANEYSQIKSVLLCPGAGQSGFTALGEILKGEINPSGKTVDTYVKDLTKTPTVNNFGSTLYDNMTDYKIESMGGTTSPSFVNYVEGIYVGYKYYETAFADGVIDYDAEVMYPFGYGLSYTTFSQEMGELETKDGQISFDVTVTNTGDAEGKDVVEVYYNPPYTNGGIEKSAANLIAFEKTSLLKPGESETIHISFAAEDMASYDTYGAGAYVLEAGNYEISINSDSHNKIASKEFTVEETITYDQNNARSTDKIAASNQFADAEGDVTYLSRKDGFANYSEATAAPKNKTLAAKYADTFLCNQNYNPEDYNNEEDEMPAQGVDSGLKLADLRGADYDDANWEKLLDQMSVSDMDTLISSGGYQNAAIESIGKIQALDCDGPSSINNNFTGTSSIGFPATTVLASTWNKELAKTFGESIGTMADEMGVSGWYAPAVNTHRNAFCGRNFEYYSEDGVLAGEMAEKAVEGAAEKGVYSIIKHFALNDQETDRYNMLMVWSNEQAIREIYLKPFEIAIKKGGAMGVMGAYNFIGNEPAEACSVLLKNVLRDEWGFKGFTETDMYGGFGWQDSDRMIRNGTDLMLCPFDSETNHLTDTASATSIQAMRDSCKNILYTVVNSRAYAPENLNEGMANWEKLLLAIDIISGILIIALEILSIRRFRKETKTNIIIKVE